jgi:hypothetical protein
MFSRKYYPICLSRIRDPGPQIFSHPGSKGQRGTGSWIRNTLLIALNCGQKSSLVQFLYDEASDADPEQGSGAFLTPGSGMGKKSGSGSGMNNPVNISKSLETIFWVKILKFSYADPGSGIWDGQNSDTGSGINIPDPQHWAKHCQFDHCII